MFRRICKKIQAINLLYIRIIGSFQPCKFVHLLLFFLPTTKNTIFIIYYTRIICNRNETTTTTSKTNTLKNKAVKTKSHTIVFRYFNWLVHFQVSYFTITIEWSSDCCRTDAYSSARNLWLAECASQYPYMQCLRNVRSQFTFVFDSRIIYTKPEQSPRIGTDQTQKSVTLAYYQMWKQPAKPNHIKQ